MNELKKFWVHVSAYYQKTISDVIIAMYAQDCEGFTYEQMQKAFDSYRKTNNASFFPLPAVLINILRPPFDEDAEANEVVSKIVQCMRPWKSAGEARVAMGELAWEVVQGLGGWNHLGQQPPPDSYALRDMREMAKAKISRAKQGRAEELPAIPGSNKLLLS